MAHFTILHNEYTSFVEEKAGFSVYIEIDGKKILFDTSMKRDIIENAKQAKIDLTHLDYVILSHGHYDHSDGLMHLDYGNIAHILAHPDCFQKKFVMHQGKEIFIGCPLHLEYLQRETDVILSKKPYWIINQRLVFLGEIPRRNEFEAKNPIGYDENHKPDFVLDDSAIVIKSPEGLVVISGCSHAGICNIIEYAKEVCSDERVLMVLGGFHIFESNLIQPTIQYFQKLKCPQIYPAHCLSDEAFTSMEKIGGTRFQTLETFTIN